MLNGLSHHRRHHVRRPSRDADPHHAGGGPAGTWRSPSATALSGRDLLVAIAAGCEITTRVGVGIDYPAFRARGWHGPGVFGPFGAAAAVGRLRRFDAETMARAFGLAGSQSAGTFAAWGTPTVKFHQCRGALSGLMAALLAEQKFVATREFLTAKDGGLYNTYSNGGRAEAATADLGSRWELEQIALRLWPSASSIQGMMTALFDIVEKHGIDPAQVKTLRIGAEPAGVRPARHALRNYKAKFEALLSAHYVAAAILHDREMTLAQFEPARYDDPKLRRVSPSRSRCAPIPRSAACRRGRDRDRRRQELTRRAASIRAARPRTGCRARRSRASSAPMPRAGCSDAQVEDVIARGQRAWSSSASVRTLMDMLRETPRRERAPIAAVARA